MPFSELAFVKNGFMQSTKMTGVKISDVEITEHDLVALHRVFRKQNISAMFTCVF